jgi:hypothetical protein
LSISALVRTINAVRSLSLISGTSEHIRSTPHQTLLVVNAAGEQHNATLSGMDADVFAGQVVTHCWAAIGRNAALNHPIRQQYVSKRSLEAIVRHAEPLLPTWVLVSFLSIAVRHPCSVACRRPDRRRDPLN